MGINEQDSRQLIIDAAKALLEVTEDVDKITVRQISKRAGVGIGLINYHFKSKDNLLSIAIGDIMANAIWDFTYTDEYFNLEPIAKLKVMIKELCTLIGSNEKLIRFMLTREIMDGNMQTPLQIIPLLKEVFGDAKDDMQLRIIALQILHPLQVTGLNAPAFYIYSGIDLSSTEQRNGFIDMLIDNLVSQN